jgi:hypothetical protein
MEAAMNRILVSMAAAVALMGASSVQAEAAEEIVEKHLSAVGGRAALSRLSRSVTTGTVAMPAQSDDLGGSLGTSRKAPNKSRAFMKLDLTALGGSATSVDQRFNGETAYASNGLQGDREIAGSQLQTMRHASFPSLQLTCFSRPGVK